MPWFRDKRAGHISGRTDLPLQLSEASMLHGRPPDSAGPDRQRPGRRQGSQSHHPHRQSGKFAAAGRLVNVHFHYGDGTDSAFDSSRRLATTGTVRPGMCATSDLNSTQLQSYTFQYRKGQVEVENLAGGAANGPTL